MTEAESIINRFALEPHPEGGWYRQTWLAPATPGTRPAGSCILFLLKAGERSHWHRIDVDEIWLFNAGAPLALSVAATAAGPAKEWRLSASLDPNSGAGDHPQVIVPARHWQAARSLGAWSLVSCMVSPAFRFEHFELAAPEFDIPRR
ncbi:MAG: cupin domain-containing protein [Pararhodobacter sp.]